MQTYSYEFIIYLDKQKEDWLFKALVEDRENYYIIPLYNDVVDEVSKEIFLDLLNGEYEIELIDNVKFRNEKKIEKNKIILNNENPLDNLKQFSEIAPQFLGLEVEFKNTNFKNSFSFKFQGNSLNLKFGLPPEQAKQIENIVSSIVASIISPINNTNFGACLQMQQQVSSTLIPFMTEKIDTQAIDILYNAINDIKNNQLNQKLLNENKLYKVFIKKIKDIIKIKDLDYFELILYKKESVKLKKNNIKSIKLYGNKITKSGIIRYYYPLKNQNVNSLVVDVKGVDYHLHIFKSRNNYEKLDKIAKSSEGTEIKFEGYQRSEYTIDVDRLEIKI